MNKRYFIFLVIYSFTMGLLLYGIGETYDLETFFTTQLPAPPTNEWEAIFYPVAFAWAIITLIVNIPIRAFMTLSLISQENMAIGVFILLPAIFCVVAIFADIASLVRGSGG